MSREPVVVIGLAAEGLPGLSPGALAAVRRATFLAGGRRHLALAGPTDAETFVIADNVGDLVARLARRGPSERCVVLASGDPLFFGIGRRLTEALGRDEVRVMTAVSAMQLAFARAGVSWHDAAVASVHGRPLKETLLPLLGRPKIGLFTRDGDSPAEIAAFFNERGLDEYDAWVGEDLGSPAERVTATRIAGLLGRRFSDLNVVLLVRSPPPPALPVPTDEAFARPDAGPVLLTHGDVRSLVVRRFRGLGPGPVWDVGAGLGGVAVELARAFPDREVVAFERSGHVIPYLNANRARFGAYNLRVVAGEAPECLDGEAPPAGAFLGGSGGRLGAILDALFDRLPPGGRLVANFVGLENVACALERLRAAGWTTELIQVQIADGRPLAGLTTLVPLRPVWTLRADRP